MFCVMNIQKRKRNDITGIQKEATRTATNYNNRVQPGMDFLNVNLTQSNNWMQDIQAEIDRAGVKTRSNSVVALDAIYTASGDFFKGKSTEECNRYFQDCLQFHQRRFGHVVSAVIHYDETTPHLHILSVPLTQDGRLSAREIVGNRANLSRMQTEFYEQVGRDYGLERGMQMDGQEKKKHITAQEWQLQQVRQEKSKELEELEAIKHSKLHARARAQKAKEQAQKQEMRNRQAEIDSRRVQREYEAQKGNLQKVKTQYKHLQEQVEQVRGFLTTAEQRQLEELQKQVEEDFEL